MTNLLTMITENLIIKKGNTEVQNIEVTEEIEIEKGIDLEIKEIEVEKIGTEVTEIEKIVTAVAQEIVSLERDRDRDRVRDRDRDRRRDTDRDRDRDRERRSKRHERSRDNDDDYNNRESDGESHSRSSHTSSMDGVHFKN